MIGGALPGVRFVEDEANRGLVEIVIAGVDGREPIDLHGVRLMFDR